MTKKLLFISLLTFLFSCKKSTDDVTKPTYNITPQNKLMSAGDGQWDLLGYGYDMTGDYANSNSATFPVIDVEKLRIAYPTMTQAWHNIV